MAMMTDAAIRARVFADLDAMLATYDTFLPRQALLEYSIDGVPLPLIDYSRGIRNPSAMDATLSVVSSQDGPYQDHSPLPGVWRYDYRAGSSRGDNTKLVRAFELGVDIVLFLKPAPGMYQPVYPVRVVENRATDGYVMLALSELADLSSLAAASPVERKWAETLARRRVHQPAFRKMVLSAYATQCTVCRFRHAELLDAAHIIGDREDWGDAVITNGMAMCKIHHAAYDQDFLGIDPDYRVHINKDLLEEVDGPMLQHGLKEMHGTEISLPARKSDHPAKERLEQRFSQFLTA